MSINNFVHYFKDGPEVEIYVNETLMISGTKLFVPSDIKDVI
jgi:hypothetical protein